MPSAPPMMSSSSSSSSSLGGGQASSTGFSSGDRQVVRSKAPELAGTLSEVVDEDGLRSLLSAKTKDQLIKMLTNLGDERAAKKLSSRKTQSPKDDFVSPVMEKLLSAVKASRA